MPRSREVDEFSPMPTPGQTITPPPSQALSPTSMGLAASSLAWRGAASAGWVGVRNWTTGTGRRCSAPMPYRLLWWSFSRSFHQTLLDRTRPQATECLPNLTCLDPIRPVGPGARPGGDRLAGLDRGGDRGWPLHRAGPL